jgi:hydrogenase/urease accessory protein HupE
MKRRVLALVAALLVVGVARRALAHEVRPGYLEIRQSSAETFEVLWKVPAQGDLRLSIHARFPENCQPAGEAIRFRGADSFSERSTLACQGGLDGRSISIEGLSATMTDVLVRMERLDGTTQTARLAPSSPAFVVEAAPSRLQVSSTYLRLGVEHILFGIDHLLFVFALLLLVRSGKRLVATVTAFTVAHSLTLAAATLGFVHVPQSPVEAVIALSIVFVATEIIRGRQGRPGLTERWPWLVAFIFGLLHGFGFAGALSQVGLPQQAIPLALFFFNVGVEAGQLIFISAMLGLLAAGHRIMAQRPAWTWRLTPYAIGSVAAYWTLDRVAGFWK